VEYLCLAVEHDQAGGSGKEWATRLQGQKNVGVGQVPYFALGRKNRPCQQAHAILQFLTLGLFLFFFELK